MDEDQDDTNATHYNIQKQADELHIGRDDNLYPAATRALKHHRIVNCYTVNSDRGTIEIEDKQDNGNGNLTSTDSPAKLELKEILVSLMPAYMSDETREYKVLECVVTGRRGEVVVQKTKKGEETSKVMKQRVIVKSLSKKPDVDDFLDIKILFSIECRMFKEIIPFLLPATPYRSYSRRYANSNIAKVRALFQKCYYSCSKNGVIVVEDIETKGYRIYSRNMDLDHAILAVQSLARFHTLTYAMKKKDCAGFYARVARRVRKEGHRHINTDKLYAHAYLQALQYAALQPLHELARKSSSYDIEIERINYLLEDTAGLINDVLLPKEPLAVLCHGNFINTNIYFKYDSSKKPINAKLVDWQNVHYGSPGLDLSLFMFLHVSAHHWEQVFSTYHSTLLEALIEFLGCSFDEVQTQFSFESMAEELYSSVLYGYVLTCGHIVSGQCKENVFLQHLPPSEEINNFIMDNFKIDCSLSLLKLVNLLEELMKRNYFSKYLSLGEIQETVL